MTRMELFEVIRREHFLEGKSVRQVSREQHVHRRDVRRAIKGEAPVVRGVPERASPVLGPIREIVDRWLLADREAPRKQRHTAHRIWERLCVEHGFQGAASTVRRYVGRRKRELGLRTAEVFIEQEHRPGDEAEVDFGEALVELGGVLTTVCLLLVRCCFSGRTVVVGFERQTQQSFLEGICVALQVFGGVFARLRFDNLSAAVRRVLRGRRRKETDRFVACRSHYLFEAVFCRPGKAGAHEKGGVEGEVGRFRRNHLVPVPKFPDIQALNRWLLAECAADESRRMQGHDETVGQLWAQVSPLLRPLPAEPFDTAEAYQPRVDNKSRVSVLRNFYSVPTTFVGRTVSVEVASATITIRSGGETLAVHQRLQGVMQESLQLDHYLEWLQRKPGALSGSKVLGQARRRGTFPECYERLWLALTERYGDAQGTRQLIDVLVLLRSHDAEEVTMAVELAMSYRCVDAASVENIVRQMQSHGPLDVGPMVDLGALLAYERPPPDLRRYDAWYGKEVH